MSNMQKFLTFCCKEQWEQNALWQMESQGDVLCMKTGEFTGGICFRPIDSGEGRQRWTRIKIDTDIPENSILKVYVKAEEEIDETIWPQLVKDGETDWHAVRSFFEDKFQYGTDLLAGQTGRYLWMAIEVAASGILRPEIRSVSVRMEGDHMIDYLPSIYREEDFTYRYLSIFDSMFQDMEDGVNQLPGRLDLTSADPEMLSLLAQWLCVDTDGDLESMKAGTLLDDFETMYTVEGIRESARRLTGRRPLVIEHFQVDPNDPECGNSELYRRLYREDPYRFFLLFPQDTFSNQNELEQFTNQMKERIPAETEMELVLLKPCIQLDWHTYLGVNSHIGSYVNAEINEMVTIHYDTMIGGKA